MQSASQALSPPLASSTSSRCIEEAANVVGAETRRWCLLAVGSLVIAGLLSLSVVLGRLPVLSRIIDDPMFFKRCLVVHVDLALVVWFYAFLAGLVALCAPRGESRVRRGAFALAVGGVVAMLAGALMRGAQPVLANYVPVIDHPLFCWGLAAFFAGILLNFVHVLVTPFSSGQQAPRIDGLPRAAAIGFQAAAVIAVLAGSTWVSARAGLPEGLDPYTTAEFLAWGPGHVLQAANTCAMLAVWLWLLVRVTGEPVLSERGARIVFTALILPQCAMPLLTLRGTLDPLYHSGATQLMRWGIFPAVVVVFVMGARHLWRQRGRFHEAGESGRVALIGFSASAALSLLGLILGACIHSSTTLVPAHYHASLGAVTVSFMTAAYLVCEAVLRGDRERGPGDGVWRSAWWQLVLFGAGQTVFVLGFAIGGLYGLGRKTYAAEQHVRGAGEVTGLIIMGVGGLLAVVGGIWFLFLVLREMRGWWSRRATAPAEPFAMTNL